MKKIKKSVLKEDYYYELKSFYDDLLTTLSVPSYRTEIFPRTMTHKEIIETYKITPSKNIGTAFAMIADCIPTLENDYKGRIAYFLDDKDTLCRLYVYRDSDGRLRVYVGKVDLVGGWDAGFGVLFSNNDAKSLDTSDTLSLEPLDTSELSIKEGQAIEMLKSRGFKITIIETKEIEY